MSLTLNYTDAYLKNRVTESIEATATSDVEEIGTFPSEWKDRLIVIRAYILTCLEQGGQDGDTFAVKLKQYRQEWDFVLSQAKHAASAANPTNPMPVLSIPIERA